ncbi:hypothetical protein SARC_06307 [Sphaeroforma arctica JP610]|uniref:Uncharacterized protein n=1 Tax=Sphaeroforma arctica JP610 TaxID=667725 RepID=A0A0L0FX01_9EUKA|nr:hypothetical protein, variant [Sphaeroforma arctica JP610]XP_014155264.1 hypothetical protein SARC_06307 [Sphaeroforma arctica JP610]KNC81361.1 hypothetical protein, variant [Sphaeroforma arctica JP610]KNC81362.1 hypothetical protein SARC_06307 [Sphaeroforma arctica JP610]|eukprot:XP_014155263.1 hypothetical protein, variant [Sphaeroforma arctica JP610]
MGNLDNKRTGRNRRRKRNVNTTAHEHQYKLHTGLSFLYGTPTLVGTNEDGSTPSSDGIVLRRYRQCESKRFCTARHYDDHDQGLVSTVEGTIGPNSLDATSSKTVSNNVLSACGRAHGVSRNHDSKLAALVGVKVCSTRQQVAATKVRVPISNSQLTADTIPTTRAGGDTPQQTDVPEVHAPKHNDQLTVVDATSEAYVGVKNVRESSPPKESVSNCHGEIVKEVTLAGRGSIRDPIPVPSSASISSETPSHTHEKVSLDDFPHGSTDFITSPPGVPKKPPVVTNRVDESESAELSALLRNAADYYDTQHKTSILQSNYDQSLETDNCIVPKVAIDLHTILPDLISSKLVASLNPAIFSKLRTQSPVEIGASCSKPAILLHLYGQFKLGSEEIVVDNIEPAAVFCLDTGKVLPFLKTDQSVPFNKQTVQQYMLQSKSEDWNSLRSFLIHSPLASAQASHITFSGEKMAGDASAHADNVLVGWGAVNAGLGIGIDYIALQLQSHGRSKDNSLPQPTDVQTPSRADVKTNAGASCDTSTWSWRSLCLVVDSIAIPHWLEFNYTAPAVDLYHVNLGTSACSNLDFSIHDQTGK